VLIASLVSPTARHLYKSTLMFFDHPYSCSVCPFPAMIQPARHTSNTKGTDVKSEPATAFLCRARRVKQLPMLRHSSLQCTYRVNTAATTGRLAGKANCPYSYRYNIVSCLMQFSISSFIHTKNLHHLQTPRHPSLDGALSLSNKPSLSSLSNKTVLRLASIEP
jgi:hypothetical protein